MAKLNKNEFKWFLILLGFTYYIYILLSTDKIYLFIHPRMVKYVHFSLIIFIVLTIVQFKRMFSLSKSKSRKINLCVFLLPLVLGIYINPQGLSGEIAGKKGTSSIQNNITKTSIATSLNYPIEQNTQKNNVPVNVPVIQNTVSNANPTAKQNDLDKSKISIQSHSNSNTSQNNEIVIDSSNFTHLVNDICNSEPNKYKGKKITITGFVYRDETIGKNEFLIARLMIICCAADADVVGLISDWSNKASTLKDDQWVTVTGVIDSEMHKNYYGPDQLMPIIRVEKIVNTEKPKNQYIYPEKS